MNRKDLIQEMKDSVGVKDPIVFFTKMTDLFDLLFDKIENLESENNSIRTLAALAIEWEPKLASNMLIGQINIMRADKQLYHNQISAFKEAYSENKVTKDYVTFVNFWTEILGWHPFLTY